MDPLLLHEAWRMLYNNNQTHIIHIMGLVGYTIAAASGALICWHPSLLSLRFSKTHKLWSSKATFTMAFFTTVNHNYNHKQRTLKHRNTQIGSKSTIHNSQTITLWNSLLSKVLFPKRSAKIIDGSEKGKCQLAFEIQNLRVFEKRGNM